MHLSEDVRFENLQHIFLCYKNLWERKSALHTAENIIR